MSSHYEIHSIFVAHHGSPVEIYVSRKYRTDIRNRRILISAVPYPEDVLPDERVASFTCLFGENGCGKTKLLTDLAATFSVGNSKQIGVLFSQDGRLHLHRGLALAGMSVDSGGVFAELAAPPEVPVVFYTTSPFDNERRRLLKQLGVIDMTPSFGVERAFEGLSLIMHCDEIGGAGAAIVSDLEMTVRGRVSREQTIGKLMEELLRRYAVDEDSPLERTKTMVARATGEMPPEARRSLLADLIIMSDIERGGNVAGRFVGDLMRLAKKAMSDPESVTYYEIGDAAHRAIAENPFVGFTGKDVLAGLRLMKEQLDLKRAGVRFTVDVAPARMREVLGVVEQTYPGLPRFMAQYDFIDFKLSRLSSGQTAFLYLFAALGTALDRITAEGVTGPVWLMLDEGEMFMHPAWQREYVENILDFIARFKRRDLDVHVMISTHSLIVAADAPPRSLFNVQKGQRMNGFGLGPGATLKALYGVENFAGDNAAPKVAELAAFLRDANAPVTDHILRLRDALADLELKKYVEAAILSRRRG